MLIAPALVLFLGCANADHTRALVGLTMIVAGIVAVTVGAVSGRRRLA